MSEFTGAQWTRDGVSVSIGRVPCRKSVAFYTSAAGIARVHGYFASEEQATEAIRLLNFVVTGNGEPPERCRPESGSRKLTRDEAKQAREYRATGNFSTRDLAAMFGVARSTMSYILHGITYPEAGGPVERIGSVKYTRSVMPVDNSQ